MAGYVFVDRNTEYKGVDRGPWRQIEDIYYQEGHRGWKQWYRDHVLNAFSEKIGVPMVTEDSLTSLAAIVASSNLLSTVELIYVDDGEDRSGPSINHSIFYGYDMYFSGYGSPIVEGINRRKKIFNRSYISFNEFGLLPSIEMCEKYMELYKSLEKSENLEIFSECGVDGVFLKVWGVSLQK